MLMLPEVMDKSGGSGVKSGSGFRNQPGSSISGAEHRNCHWHSHLKSIRGIQNKLSHVLANMRGVSAVMRRLSRSRLRPIAQKSQTDFYHLELRPRLLVPTIALSLGPNYYTHQ